MKKIFVVLVALLLVGCGNTLSDKIVTRAIVNANYDSLGEYGLVEADSSEVTEEALKELYNTFQKKDLEYLVVVYKDDPAHGVYMIENMIETGVTLQQDENADYLLADDTGAKVITP